MAEGDTSDERSNEKPKRPPEEDFEPTISKIRRGALPEDDPLMRLHKGIEELRAFAARL